jgi:hypothetical protein
VRSYVVDMPRWANIRYRDFWDVPRMFVVSDGTRTFLFDCPFDPELDDYPPIYTVWLMPSLTESDLAGSWEQLPGRARRLLGRVRVEEVHFDSSKRRAIEVGVLTRIGGTDSSPT